MVSANVSYQNAAKDVEVLTGIYIDHSTQQRLVHRQEFVLPTTEQTVEELSVDGGKVRLRTPQGQECLWRDYKGVRLHGYCTGAFFQDNVTLLNWVNQQILAPVLTCLGDGHDGIWNIINGIATPQQRREVLDWFHLVENLYKVGGSYQRLAIVKTHLWRGHIDAAIEAFADWSTPQVENLLNYLTKHRHRLHNYQYLQQQQVCSIGSGAVESAVKQIDRRVKISGAQWKMENVSQVLAHRCAYLNGTLAS